MIQSNISKQMKSAWYITRVKLSMHLHLRQYLCKKLCLVIYQRGNWFAVLAGKKPCLNSWASRLKIDGMYHCLDLKTCISGSELCLWFYWTVVERYTWESCSKEIKCDSISCRPCIKPQPSFPFVFIFIFLKTTFEVIYTYVWNVFLSESLWNTSRRYWFGFTNLIALLNFRNLISIECNCSVLVDSRRCLKHDSISLICFHNKTKL